MDDKRMLELAAKACGFRCSGRYDYQFGLEVSRPHNAPRNWNPLKCEADALRLAETLSIGLHWCISGRVYAHAQGGIEVCESSREDRISNLCRAIVRVAAEIGDVTP